MASRDPPTSFDKVADLETAEDANLHGVITNVSPMKKGGGASPCFDAKLCDGEKRVRIVGFSSA